ncbi:MAG: nucleotidyltransferase family protein [Oscillospiraceae bacterium]
MNLQMQNLMTAVSNALHKTNIPLQDPDFDEIFKLASVHSILPIAFEGCIADEKFKDFSDSVKYKNGVYQLIFLQATRAAKFTDIYSKLIENGITPLVVKGIFCRNMYGDLCDHRPSSDEDILIPLKDFSKAKDILMSNGFTIPKEDEMPEDLSTVQEITFRHAESRLNIEIHINLFGERDEMFLASNDYFKDVFDNYVSFVVNGQQFYTIEYTKNYIFLFLHLYKHFITFGVGIRQIIDLLMFKEKYGQLIDWNEVERVIKSKSLWQFYEDLIAIGNEYLGFSFPDIHGSKNIDMLLEDIEKSGTFGTTSKEHAKSSAFIDSAMLSEGGDQSKISVLFPPYDKMKIGYPVLYKMPWLLPFMWIKRLFKYFIKLFNKKDRNSISESKDIANERLKLLKKYNIIK